MKKEEERVNFFITQPQHVKEISIKNSVQNKIPNTLAGQDEAFGSSADRIDYNSEQFIAIRTANNSLIRRTIKY